VISPNTTAPGVTDPVKQWTPVISPSGIAFYEGEAFPGWRGNLFLAGLRPPGLTRLTIEGERITGEEKLLEGMARFRDVLVGPDGRIYILTDEARGRVLRLEPAG
jgi:glucose/arabinose dehydrogenase